MSAAMSVSFARSRPYQSPVAQPSLGPTISPAPSLVHQDFLPVPPSATLPRRHGGHHSHHHRHVKPVVTAPSPSDEQSCDQICTEPLTTVPFGSPCGCVFPMKVRLLLDVAPYAVFPVMRELESEVAAGHVSGRESVIYISYPGIPSSSPYPNYTWSGPSGSTGDLPITAHFVNKNQRMNLRTIAIITLSAFVVLVVFTGAIAIVIRWRKSGRPSVAVGPAFTSSINKRSGIGSFLSGSVASSTSISLMSNMATCMLSVKTFTFTELEKATDKFSSKRILGEGGFGRVFSGSMEDGAEVAVKLLTRDNQNGDREFIAEVEMLSRLHHRNLVKLIGICIEGRARCLVYELVRNGSSFVSLSEVLVRREGLETLVDPSLAGSYDFDDMAKVAAIASMCVHSEVTNRPFMGEVVQALKLIYNDTDETCGDYSSQKGSSGLESDFKGDLVPSDSSWWNAGGTSPRLTYGQASSFITMQYSSGPLEEMENRPFSTLSLARGWVVFAD
ncbi:hypothetical protein OIU84_016974 [Salix udensis]|uniref:Protein kinase domain-containing protein n=1 Tax=Salix udensis TaxID=889485 RepID=A0AAD6JAR0_9ROSI|nr:hypothetical protein OIU84_016974 [Salix udensis]